MKMLPAALAIVLLGCLAAAPSLAADWTPAERIETYAVEGGTGIELYRSIGRNGPLLGVRRAIAYTTFDLKWTRNYVPQKNGACTLVAARPHLTVIYRLPKPATKLPAATQRLWDAFAAGIAAHERVHGGYIVEMTKKIEAMSTGLTVADDPKCTKVRAELQERLGPLSEEQRRKGRAFDAEEMRDGGNMHRLVLGLVNGG